MTILIPVSLSLEVSIIGTSIIIHTQKPYLYLVLIRLKTKSRSNTLAGPRRKLSTALFLRTYFRYTELVQLWYFLLVRGRKSSVKGISIDVHLDNRRWVRGAHKRPSSYGVARDCHRSTMSVSTLSMPNMLPTVRKFMSTTLRLVNRST